MKPILLFDIDGTLLNTKKSFTKEMIAEILRELGMQSLKINNRSFAGRTDRDIFFDLVSAHPEAETLYKEAKQLYLGYMRDHYCSDHANLIHGVAETVQYAQEQGFEIGLCTGNFRESAYYKVEAIGLEGAFEFGGFGCNHSNRNYLPQEAHREFVIMKGYEPQPQQYIIIGDTPNDIESAKYFGARSVSVSTGSFTKNELQKYHPNLLIDNLLLMKEWLHKQIEQH